MVEVLHHFVHLRVKNEKPSPQHKEKNEDENVCSY